MFPSICDVVTGLKTLFEMIVDKKMRGQKAQRISEVKEQYSAKVFSRLFDLGGITRPFEPLTAQQLKDAKDPSTILILWLTTIEPPFYACLSKECIAQDLINLDTLGPFAFALELILTGAEQSRKDAVKTGQDIGIQNSLGFFAGSFLLFKGAFLTDNRISAWRSALVSRSSDQQQPVQIRGHMSANENYRIALNQIKRISNREDAQQVLFVILMQNYAKNGLGAFRLNGETYSAHPDEQEVLLMDGLPVFVLHIEQVFVENPLSTDNLWKHLNG